MPLTFPVLRGGKLGTTGRYSRNMGIVQNEDAVQWRCGWANRRPVRMAGQELRVGPAPKNSMDGRGAALLSVSANQTSPIAGSLRSGRNMGCPEHRTLHPRRRCVKAVARGSGGGGEAPGQRPGAGGAGPPASGQVERVAGVRRPRLAARCSPLPPPCDRRRPDASGRRPSGGTALPSGGGCARGAPRGSSSPGRDRWEQSRPGPAGTNTAPRGLRGRALRAITRWQWRPAARTVRRRRRITASTA